MGRPAKVSPERILAAAAAEFAARGYAGARVDRIARRARVNKAMLYYHFDSKQGLYRELLRGTFSRVSHQLQEIAQGGGPADAMLDRAVQTIADVAHAQPFFPAVMLREVAEGGAHLDRETTTTMAGMPKAFAAMIAHGVSSGAFRPVHPLAAYFSIVAPLILFIASAPIRSEIQGSQALPFAMPDRETFIAHVQQMLRRALAREAPSTAQEVSTPR